MSYEEWERRFPNYALIEKSWHGIIFYSGINDAARLIHNELNYTLTTFSDGCTKAGGPNRDRVLGVFKNLNIPYILFSGDKILERWEGNTNTIQSTNAVLQPSITNKYNISIEATEDEIAAVWDFLNAQKLNYIFSGRIAINDEKSVEYEGDEYDVEFGDKVSLKNKTDGSILTVIIVQPQYRYTYSACGGAYESAVITVHSDNERVGDNMDGIVISSDSPLGRAILNKPIGADIAYSVDGSFYKYSIASIMKGFLTREELIDA